MRSRENGPVHSKPGKEPRRFDLKLLIASFGIAVGIVAIVWGLNSSVTGDEEQDLPETIESINPVRGATQVLQQSSVFVDLAEGYEGELTIDGVVIPTLSLDELSSAPGVSTPQPGEQITLPPVAVYEPGTRRSPTPPSRTARSSSSSAASTRCPCATGRSRRASRGPARSPGTSTSSSVGARPNEESP